MTQLLHIVGPQGAGKTMVAQMIVAGAAGRAAHLHWEAAAGLSNAQIRSQFAGMHWVCVEADRMGPRHADLQPGDAVMTICAAIQNGVCDAA